MKILVCVKVINGELNPFDEYALECALQLSKDVTVITMGPKSCEEVLKPLTRLGAKVILATDSLYAGSDTLVTAYILSELICKTEFDLILCGRQSVDGDTAQVGPMLAQMLGVSLITNALSVQLSDEAVAAKTRIGEETTNLPALVTVERGYVLRFPSIFSKLGEVTAVDNNYIGCDAEKCGLNGSPTRVLQTFENQRGKRKCKYISKDELLPLIEQLKNKTAENENVSEQTEKFETVWAVGDEVYEKALEIAENVIKIEKDTPESIAERACKEQPSVILWNADLWGRKTAPQVAAILKTGLCADCTKLEAEGDTLIMYRPARGGNVYAKIKCLTVPQMATVRTKAESSDIIVSGGKGVIDQIDAVKDFAQSLNADFCASRGLVDAGQAEYECQVGLTGKMVSPKIYIVIGISGAVHHTCAIEGADTVIAINPDKDARIFEYADYGIVENF